MVNMSFIFIFFIPFFAMCVLDYSAMLVLEGLPNIEKLISFILNV